MVPHQPPKIPPASSDKTSPPASFAARKAEPAAPDQRKCKTPRCHAVAVKGKPRFNSAFARLIPSAAPQSETVVNSASARGETRKVTSVKAPKVPIAPAHKRDKSNPATFLITRPPKRSNSPRPSAISTPKTKSRAAPANGRRGPDNPAAKAPPNVAPTPPPSKCGGSNASI